MTAKLKPLLPKRSNRWMIRLAVVAAAGLGVLLWIQIRSHKPTLTIQNQAGQPIPSLKVKVGEETRAFNDVAAGAEVSVPLRNRTESVRVELRLADGELHTYTGRAAESEDSEPVLVVTPGGQIGPRKSRK